MRVRNQKIWLLLCVAAFVAVVSSAASLLAKAPAAPPAKVVLTEVAEREVQGKRGR